MRVAFAGFLSPAPRIAAPRRKSQMEKEAAAMAAWLGFEPRQRDPESLVLPLHHQAKRVSMLANPRYRNSNQTQKIRDLFEPAKPVFRAIRAFRDAPMGF